MAVVNGFTPSSPLTVHEVSVNALMDNGSIVSTICIDTLKQLGIGDYLDLTQEILSRTTRRHTFEATGSTRTRLAPFGQQLMVAARVSQENFSDYDVILGWSESGVTGNFLTTDLRLRVGIEPSKLICAIVQNKDWHYRFGTLYGMWAAAWATTSAACVVRASCFEAEDCNFQLELAPFSQIWSTQFHRAKPNSCQYDVAGWTRHLIVSLIQWRKNQILNLTQLRNAAGKALLHGFRHHYCSRTFNNFLNSGEV